MRFIYCDGLGGDGDAVNVEAIVNVKVYEVATPDENEFITHHAWDVVLGSITGETHKYGSYMDETEARAAQKWLTTELEKEYNPHEPAVSVEYEASVPLGEFLSRYGGGPVA